MTATLFLGGGLVLTQFGLRHIHPLSGAAISIPSFTVCFLLASPFLLHGETIVWNAVPIFAAVGLVFPALLTLITFSSNRALGPVVTASLGNISPLFSVLLAVVLLGEPLRLWQFVGLLIDRRRRPRHHRHAHPGHAQLAHLGAAAAARRGRAARRHPAGHQGRAGNLAEPDGGRPRRLHLLDHDRADGGARAQRPLHRARADTRTAVVRAHRHLQRHRHATDLCRARRRTRIGGGADHRGLSDGHGHHEHDGVRPHARRAAARRRRRDDGGRAWC